MAPRSILLLPSLAALLLTPAPALACQGAALPAPTPILLTPRLAKAKGERELAAVKVQNLEEAAATPRVLTFGHLFARGKLGRQEGLAAATPAGRLRAQADPLAYWPDGSVRLAAVSVELPELCPRSELPLMLTRERADPAPALRPDPAALRLEAELSFTGGPYAGNRKVDFTPAIRAALAGKADYWLRGPLAAQFRVEIPLYDAKSPTAQALRLSADLTVQADGKTMADVQFHNDRVAVLPKSGKVNPTPPLAPLEYAVDIRFGAERVRRQVRQDHYTAWHVTLGEGGDGAAVPHVQHDAAYLREHGFMLPYDLNTGVNPALLREYAQRILAAPDFGQPLAANGVTLAMPTTGARPDIGYTTQYNTVWLLTQDPRAARVALAQADASGAIPWNYRLPTGRWLTPGDHPNAWIDPRGGPQGYTDGIAHLADTRRWIPDGAHQPDLNTWPYLLTARRWNHDRLMAQAAFSLINSWPGYRCRTPKCTTLLNEKDQVRAQAWNLRQVLAGAWYGRAGSFEQAHFASVVEDNWNYLESRLPAWRAEQGEAWGWIPGTYGNNATAPWQQDFLTGVAALAAGQGDARARAFLRAQKNWLTGRFLARGMNPRDGCAYNLVINDPTGKKTLSSWAAMQAATQAAGLSNSPKWGANYFCAVARAALGANLHLFPDDAELRQALDWLNRSGAPYIDRASSRNDPTFNIVE